MGNNLSESSPLYISDALNWRTGAISEPVPAPVDQSKAITTYEQLGLCCEFKEYMLKHIDLDNLISSVLSSAEDQEQLLKGIDKFKAADPDLADDLQQLIENFEQCVSAGINVKPIETLTLGEKQINSNFKATQGQFMAAFQRRFACLRLVQACIEHERRQALKSTVPKKGLEPEASAINQAQMMMLFGLKNAGVSLLKVFPMCYRALPDSAQDQLAQPIQQLCEHLSGLDDLELLPACTLNVLDTSNASLLDFKTAAISASSGIPSNAYDGVQSTAWTCGGGKLSLTLKSPQDIASISFAWVPNYKSSRTVSADPDEILEVGAPKRVTVFAASVDSEGTPQPPRMIFCALPSEVYQKCNSWVQTFPVNATRVRQLQIVLSTKGCVENRCENAKENIKMFNLEISLSESSASRKVKTLPLLREVQSALLPLVEFDAVTKAVFDAQLSIVRGSGSLSLFLVLINSIWSSKSEKAVQNLSAPALFKLLTAMSAADSRARFLFNTLYSSAGVRVASVSFASTTCELAENATVVRCQNKFGFAFLSSVELSGDSYEWEITILEEIDGDESLFLGAAGRTVAADVMLKSPESCLVRCYNGEIFQGKRCTLAPVDPIHKGDVCRFTYNADRKTLALAVNGKSQGVIAEYMTATLTPCVLFQSSKHAKAVKLGEVKFTAGMVTKRVSVHLPIRDKPTFDSLVAAESPLEFLLSEVRHLAEAKLHEITASDKSALVQPFCVEATLEVILLIASLLGSLKAAHESQPSAAALSMIHSLLIVLDLQVQCISLSKISLVDLGFPAPLTDSTHLSGSAACALTFEEIASFKGIRQDIGSSHERSARGAVLLRSAAQVLEELMDSSNDAPTAVLAVTAYTHGLSFFLPSTEKKLACVMEILTVDAACVANLNCLKPERLQLLKMIAQHLKETGEILQIFNLAAVSKSSAAQVVSFLHMLLEGLVTLQISALATPTLQLPSNGDSDTKKPTELVDEMMSLLSTFQQQVFYEILAETPYTDTPSRSAEAVRKRQQFLSANLLLPYLYNVINASKVFLPNVFSATLTEAQRETTMRDSILGVLLQPVVYSLSLPGIDLAVYKDIAPLLVGLMEQLPVLCGKSKYCSTARRLINSTIPRASEGVAQKAGLGWMTVKASFEDSESSFAITDNGALFTSSSTSNTCAIVTMKFGSSHKAAWEFLLETDSSNDECSTFGAARMPLTSRCYSSSPDLWMRRAYNGYLYAQGQSTGQTMDKIKPGDVVRVEFDGKAGTLSFGLNGGAMEVGFSNISEEIYPACGSYRSGVGIRLLKVEVYDALDMPSAGGGSELIGAFAKPTADIRWLVSEENNMSVRDPTLLSPTLGKNVKSKAVVTRWVTTRADKGALEGVHEYSFELTAANKAPYSVGVFVGPGAPFVNDRLAGPCYKISSKSPKTADIPGSNVRLDAAAISASTTLPPPPLAATPFNPSATLSSVQSSPDLAGDDAIAADVAIASATSPSSPAISTPANQLQDKEQVPEMPFSRTFRYPVNIMAFAWHSDGSLWHNGVKVEDDYGSSVLPLKKNDAISMRINRFERTVSFAVNGTPLGVAFGPAASGAKAAGFGLPKVSELLDTDTAKESMAVFPAGSVSSSAQALRIRATGFCGSTVIPFPMSLQKALVAIVGRVAAVLIQGPAISKAEAAIYPWFASNLMIGGIEDENPAVVKVGSSATEAGSADFQEDVLSEAEVLEALTTYDSPDITQRLKGAVDKLYSWMETIDPEPIFLRTALERSDTYKFPSCEMPFIACLLKHGGIVTQAVECVASEDTCVPSNEMVALWQRVKQLRVYLRTQRQALRSSEHSKTEQMSMSTPAAETHPGSPTSALGAATSRSGHDDSSSSGSSSGSSSDDSSSEGSAEEPFAPFPRRGRPGFAVRAVDAAARGRPPPPDVAARAASGSEAAVTVPNTPQTPSIAIRGAAGSGAVAGEEANLYFSEDIYWIPQPSTVVSSHSAANYCNVLALGFDFANELIFVRFHQQSESSSSDVPSSAATRGTLYVGETTSLSESDSHIEVNSGFERKGCLRIDYSAVDVPALYRGLLAGTAVLAFEYDNGGYSRAVLQLPAREEIGSILAPFFDLAFTESNTASAGGASAESVKVSDSQFAKLCEGIKERALFLLKLTGASVALDSSDYKAKTLLYNLTKRYSGNFPASGSNEDLSRWRAQERWKRVVEFLHMQSRSQKLNASDGAGHVSASASELHRPTRTPSIAKLSSVNSLTRINSNIKAESDMEKQQDIDSPVLAALQACAIFMISDAIPATPKELHEILEIRTNRSECRILGFQILLAALKIPAVQSAPQSVSDMLTFIKSAMAVNLPKPGKGDVPDRNLAALVDKYHYLNSLEGCSARTLSRVQAAFVDLFGACFHLLGQYLQAWESRARFSCGVTRFSMVCSDDRLQNKLKNLDAHLLLEPAQSLLHLWTLHFSTRDHQWLLHSNILNGLQKLSSLVFLEDVAGTWRTVVERCITFQQANSLFASKAPWLIWTKDYVQTNLRTGKLSHRKLLYHLFSAPVSELSADQRTELGFPVTFTVALDSLNDAQIVYLYHSVLQFVSRKTAIKEAAQKAQAAKEAELEAKKAKEVTDRLAVCGAFDPSFKGRQIQLSGYNFEASMGDDGGGTAVCAYTNVMYDISADCATTGNYFEITIVTLGRKAIGVGLADRNSFSFTNYMPGWEPHSYGYHGDDGHKFGEGRTPGDWPLFETGDIVGCGFDVRNRSIFFTRNGVLLGTGFTGVRETSLWPIVGFSNRHRMKECVKVNFGIEPFAYDSPTAMGHPAALQERIRREAEAAARGAGVGASEAACGAGESGAGLLTVAERTEDAATSLVTEDNSALLAQVVCTTAEEFEQADRSLKAQLKAAEAFNVELGSLRCQAELLQRFLLVQASQAGPGTSSPALISSGEAEPNSGNKSTAPPPLVAKAGTTPAVPVLAKEVSLFGTPRFFTTADSVVLQETITTHVLNEFMVAAAYLDQFKEPPVGAAGSMDVSTETKKESLHTLDASIVLRSDYEIAPTQCTRAVVNAYEVAEALYKHLLLLASLFDASKTIRDELTSTKAVKSLFMVVEQSYLRNRNIAFTLLLKILPTMSPDSGEEAITPEWIQLVLQFDARMQSSSYRKRVGKMPINLIQALQLSSCSAISASSLHTPSLATSCGDTQLLSQATHCLPYGVGTKALELADSKLYLLQKLFEAPLWTELVACGVTDALRNASSAVDKLIAAGNIKGGAPATAIAATAVDIEVVDFALAACATLSGLGIARNGSRISTAADEKGFLLMHSEPRQECKYVLDRNLRDLNTASHPITAPAASVEPLISVVDVDLTDLSQPLLQQFFQLVERLLRWFRARVPNSAASCSGPAFSALYRLTSVSALTLSQLLIHQSEVVNFVHDSTIIGDLVAIALRPSELNFLPSFKSVLCMWKSAQMRCLELPANNPVTTVSKDTPAASAEGAAGAAGSSFAGAEVQLEGCSRTPVSAAAAATVVDCLSIEETRQAEREKASQELCAELGVDKRLCLLYLDFHSMNISDARASLQHVKATNSAEQLAEHLAFFASEPTVSEESVVFDDNNILKKIGVFDPADFLGGSGSSRKYTAGADPSSLMSLLPVREYLRRREAVADGGSGSEASPADQIVMLVQTDLDGAHSDIMGAVQYVTADAIADSLAESLSVPAGEEAGSSKSKAPTEKSSDAFLLTQYVGMVTGVLHTDLVDPFIHYKVVHKLYGAVEIAELTTFRTQLDCNLAVQSIRSVAAKLLLDGNLNLSQDAAKQKHWTDLVKVVSTSESDSFDKVIPALCGALLVPSALNSAAATDTDASSTTPGALLTAKPSAVALSLVDDVISGLDQLSNLKLNAVGSSLSDALGVGGGTNDMLEFASPHPFPAPSATAGVIRVPATWKNIAVQFHPQCSTPSDRAMLELFSSEQDMAAQRPLLSLWGKPARWEHAKNKCIPGPIDALYYKFTAAPGSNMKPIEMKHLDGEPLLYRDGQYSVAPSTDVGKVGMGDEDTLFNLFDEEPLAESDRNSTAGCDMPYMTSGAWYYEATVMQADADPSSCIGIVSDKFSDEGFNMTTGSTHSCFYSGEGVVEQLSSVQRRSPTEWGGWKRGDVLGFLFELGDNRVRMWVSKNGVWTERFTSTETTCRWKPAVNLVGQFQLALNWGEKAFTHLPPAEIVDQLVEKRFQSVIVHANTPSSETTAADKEAQQDAWGYHFAVKPVHSLRMKLCTDFDLIKKISVDTADGASQKMWVWRPTAAGGYLPWGDVITTTEFSPRRSVLVDKSQCRPPASASLVFSNSKMDVAVWRLVAPAGYVALGDVVCGHSSSASDLPNKYRCVPDWAVQECEVTKSLCQFKKCGTSKEQTTASVWLVDNGLGAFFGSPYETRYCSADEGKPKCSQFKFFGVGKGYKLVSDTSLPIMLTGEWSTEKEVLAHPSLPWTASLLKYLLDNVAVRSLVLTPEVFTKLLQYLRSSASPSPLAAVPLLIKMIRLAQKEKVKLPLDEIKSLSRAVLVLATASKSTKASLALMRLVDFVIELQVAHVEESYDNDKRHQSMGFVVQDGCEDCEQLQVLHQLSLLEESKEEVDGVAAIEHKESEPFLCPNPLLPTAVSSSSGGSSRPIWWDRPAFSAEFACIHRGMDPVSVENIFSKDSTIMRVRQALKFIKAIISSKMNVRGEKTRPYPRLLASKIWNDHGSTATTVESAHPYKTRSFTRKIVFPGADKLHIMFDQRCALAEGDKLTISSPSLQAADGNRTVERCCLSSKALDLETLLSKGLTISGDQLMVSLETEAAEGIAVNTENLWGWSCVVHATGSVFERSDALVDITGALATTTELSPKARVDDSVMTAHSEGAAVPELLQKASSHWTAGLTAPQFAQKALDGLYKPSTEVTDATVLKGCGLDDLGKELVCLKGKLLKEGDIAVPMANSLQINVDHMVTGEGSKEGSANLVVVEFTPTYSTPSSLGTSRTADLVRRMHVFYDCPSFNESVKGDKLHYRIYVLKKQDFLYLLETAPVPEFPTVPPDAAAPTVSEQAIVNSTPAEADAASEVEVIAFSAEVPALEVAADTEADSAVAAAEEEEETQLLADSAEEQMWACEVCTLLNAPHLTECSVCVTPRPAPAARAAGHPATASSRRAAPSSAPAGGPVAVGWWCSACTFINPISLSACSMCGSGRDDGAAGHAAEEDEEDSEEEGDEEENEEEGHEDEESDGSSHIIASSDGSDSDSDNDAHVTGAGEQQTHTTSSATAGILSAGASRKSNGKDLVGVLSSDTKTKLLSLEVGQEALLIMVEGKMSPVEKFEARLLGAMSSGGAILTPAQMLHHLEDWNVEADGDLIDFLNSSNSAGKTFSSHTFALPRKVLAYCNPLLASKSLLDIQTRVQHVEAFNKHLEHLLPFIDLGNDDPHSLGALIRKCSRYLLLKIKTPLLDAAISSTTVSSGRDLPANLTLDNTKAFSSRDKAERDPTNSQNCFVQAYRQLHSKDSAAFRFTASSDRVFQTSFVGEAGIDAGGVYREAMTRIVEDLLSEHFNLLLLCPNAQQAVHSNMDKYVPNPHHASSPLALSMFEFIGKLMALSVRTKLCLPFEFPPIVWKKLVGEVVGFEDLVAIDAIACKQLEDVRHWDLEKFDPTKLRFDYIGSDKIERELVPGGKDIAVTYDNRLEFYDKLVAARLSEFDQAAAAMARGMEEVIPGRALWLFSSSQLEELVCGCPKFDMEFWRKQTDATGVSASTLSLFWQVMNTLSQKELSGFVRFAWGRSRLPAKKDFTTRMRLTSGGSATLPVSHTCFFSVELPEYRTEEAMRHGLLTAIHYGAGGILNG